MWSTREIDDWPKPYSLIKYLRMGDDIDIVYDKAAEKFSLFCIFLHFI